MTPPHGGKNSDEGRTITRMEILVRIAGQIEHRDLMVLLGSFEQVRGLLKTQGGSRGGGGVSGVRTPPPPPFVKLHKEGNATF